MRERMTLPEIYIRLAGDQLVELELVGTEKLADNGCVEVAEIEDADEIDRLRRQAVAQPVDMGAFASQLSSLEELTRRVPSLFREGLNRRG